VWALQNGLAIEYLWLLGKRWNEEYFNTVQRRLTDFDLEVMTHDLQCGFAGFTSASTQVLL
jgi:hypothetical protein